MRKMKTSYLGTLSLSMFLLASAPALRAQAQAPAAGASVAVRMIDAVNSASDPAGKQYRASVTKAVHAGNGVTIPQGSVAAVTLTNSGSSYSAHLASVTVNGQTVAVASGPANVTSGLQGAASSALSSVGSMLGGFGHHVKAPSGVTAVAMGQRVVLPPGTTLTFVLSQPPAPNSASPGTPMASAAPAAPPSPVSIHGGVASGYFISCSTSQGGGIESYVTGVFQSPVTRMPNGGFLVDQSVLNRFYAYLTQKGYKFKRPAGNSGCEVKPTEAEAKVAQHQRYLSGGCSNCGKVVETEWKDGSGEAADPAAQPMTASAAPVVNPSPAAAGPALGPNQTYALCFSEGGPIVYFSDIFAVPALPPSAFHGNGGDYRNAVYALGDHFQTFLQKKYGSKSPVSCAMNFMPTAGGLKAAQDRKQRVQDQAKQGKAQVVETGWKNTP